MPRFEPTLRSKMTKVVVLTVGIGLWYLAVLPFLFARWSPPECGNPCTGPSSQPATLIVVGALAPLILLFALTASPRRVVVLAVATAVASAVAYAIALSFESSVCPNVYADDCHGRGAVALLYWGAYVGPVLVASIGLGPIRGRSWTSFLALPLAGLLGLGIAAAPSAIEDAHIDGDVLFAYVVLWPIFAMPLVIAAVLGALARSAITRSSKSSDGEGTAPTSSAPSALS
jgi:hypothetical protein